MKHSRLIVLAVVAALAGVLVLRESLAQPKPAGPAAPAAPANTRVAVCDLVKIFANYQRTKDAEVRLTEKNRELKNQDEVLKTKLEAKEEELKGLLAGSPAYEKALDDLAQTSVTRETLVKTETAKQQRQHRIKSAEFYNDILKAAAQVAKDQGYDIVLNNDESSADSNETIYTLMGRKKVLFNSPAVDITDTVLLKLNEDYKAASKAGPAKTAP